MALGGADERVDIVDENDVVVDTVSRAKMRREVLRHRAVFILVRDAAGRVLIHRRSESKDLWPGWWDIAVGGVVGAGETYAAAARRELFEEVGIEGDPIEISGGPYEDADVRLIAKCYEVTHYGPVCPRDGEVVEYLWADIDELRLRLERDRFLPDSLFLLGPRLFGG